MCDSSGNVAASDTKGASSGGLSAGQGIMMGGQLLSSVLAQQSQYRMQNLQNRINREAAAASLESDQAILLRNMQEESEAFAQSNFDRHIQAMELESTATVMAGEAGVSGISVDAITKDIERQSGQIGVRAKKTYENRLAALEDTHSKLVSNMVSRMNNLPQATKPNLLATALDVTAPYVAAGAFDDYFSKGN